MLVTHACGFFNPPTPQATALPPTATSSPTATITPIPPTATVTPEPPCETDQTKWTFSEINPDLNLKKIEPSCVIDSLGETVAWHLLHLYGRSIHEASVQTGMYDKLMARGSKLGIPNQTPMNFEKYFGFLWLRADYKRDETGLSLIKKPAWLAPIPYWIVDDGKPVLPTMFLQGCYRTYDIVGNERVYITPEWSTYPNVSVVCKVAEDVQWDWIVNVDQDKELVYSYDDEINIGNKQGGRAFVYFVYLENMKAWYELARDPYVDHPLDEEKVTRDYEYATTTFNVPLWNEDWIKSKYGLEAVPLPADWEVHNTDADRAAMNEKINNP